MVAGPLHNQEQRILQNLLEALEELRSRGPIDNAMVARHGGMHHLSHHDLVVSNDGFGRHGADGQDGSFGRIYYCRELIDAKHAEITYGETGANVFVGLEFAIACAVGKISDLHRNLAK